MKKTLKNGLTERKKSSYLIEIAERYGAKNYLPLPVVISKGEGVWVWDADGKKYIDMLSCYSALNQGHRHPKIIKALKSQADRLTLTSRAFHNDQMGLFFEKICKLTKMEKVLPMNTGAESVETAIKMVRKWGYNVKGIPEDCAEIIACKNNFHGRTTTIISFSTETQYRSGFGPFTPGFKLIDYNSPEQLESAITKNTVAFIVEPIQGEAGVIIPSQGFLKKVRDITKRYNILLVLDEIQTGFGRTGKLFCYEWDNIKPDVLILGKALGGGIYPISVTLSSKEVMNVFNPGDHGSTFGGNPLACAVANTAIDVVLEEKLPQNSQKMGTHFINKLKKINSRYVKEIRGRGLFIGVEIKQEYGGARRFCEKLMSLGVLAKETHHQVIRFAPPLIIIKDEIDWALEHIEKVLTEEI